MEFEKLCDILAEVLGVDPKELSEETTLADDLGADSLDLYQVLLKAEEEFEVKIDPDRLQDVVTVGDALALLTRQ